MSSKKEQKVQDIETEQKVDKRGWYYIYPPDDNVYTTPEAFIKLFAYLFGLLTAMKELNPLDFAGTYKGICVKLSTGNTYIPCSILLDMLEKYRSTFSQGGKQGACIEFERRYKGTSDINIPLFSGITEEHFTVGTVH